MLVNSKEILMLARKNKFAVPSANFIDADMAKSHVETAEKLKKPLILSFAQSHNNILSLEDAAEIGKYYANKASVPIVLHLDHGEDIDYIEKAIKLGFSSVMIDGSMMNYEDNVNITKNVVNLAHRNGITVEAELGRVGSNQNDDLAEKGGDSIYTEVDDVLDFVKLTDVDSLAISIGTSHGLYKGEPNINFERLKSIYEITEIPLVLHGGSSSGFDNLSKCARNGISKINIYTDFLVNAYKELNKREYKNYIEIKSILRKSFSETLTNYYNSFYTESIK